MIEIIVFEESSLPPLDATETMMVEGIRANQSSYVEMLAPLVAQASSTQDTEGVNQVGLQLERHFQRSGLHTSVLVTGVNGHHVLARTREEGGNRLLLLGHLDTVHEQGGELREDPDHPSRLLGPGSADMKGGLVVLVAAVQALSNAGILEDRALTVLLTADEEMGSPTARSLIEAEAREHHLCLVVECGTPRLDGASAFVTERSGMSRGSIHVAGVESHGGAARGQGVSAAVEMAHLICALESLNDPSNQVSVNVGLAQAGTAVNTVPGHATLEVDCRFPTPEAGDALARAIQQIVATPTLPGAQSEMVEGVSHVPLMRTEAVGRMAERIIAWGADLGQPLVEERRGGCSDGNVAASVGCCVVDGLGVVGGHMHSPLEWMESTSLWERTALMALTAKRFYEL